MYPPRRPRQMYPYGCANNVPPPRRPRQMYPSPKMAKMYPPPNFETSKMTENVPPAKLFCTKMYPKMSQILLLVPLKMYP